MNEKKIKNYDLRKEKKHIKNDVPCRSQIYTRPPVRVPWFYMSAHEDLLYFDLFHLSIVPVATILQRMIVVLLVPQ